jgi:hypothetical protein
MPLYPLPGEQIPIETGPNGEPIIPINDLTPPLSPDTPVTPPKKTPGRLLFDKFNAGETKFTSLRYTDARDGFNKQMNLKNPYQLFPPTGYIGTAPNEKQAADIHRLRISDFFSTPRGQKFINKQIGLQLSNTRLEDVNLFSTTLNEVTKKFGVGSLDNNLAGLGNVSISPSTILSLVNVSKDVFNNGFNVNNILGAASVLVRKQTRSAISPLQNYNFQNTIDQAGTDPNTGWNHYDRFGASNIMPDNDKYWNIVRKNNGTEDIRPTDSPNNRLVKLTRDLRVGTIIDPLADLADKVTRGFRKVRSFADTANSYYNQGLGLFNALSTSKQSKDFQPINNAISDAFNFANNKLAIADRFIAPFTNNIIDQYDGGPNSLNGIGPTIIKRYDNTTDWTRILKLDDIRNNRLSEMRNLFLGAAGGTNFGPTAISQQYGKDTGVDILKGVGREVSNKIYARKNYNTIRQVNLPRAQKSVGKAIINEEAGGYNYTTVSDEPKTINIDRSSPNYKYFGDTGRLKEFERFPAQTPTEITALNESVHRIVFTPIDPFTGKPFVDPKLDSGKEDLNAGRLFFDAYISNFKDNFSPTWNDINYIGRSEIFHVFTKFKRDISFTLQIPCFNPKQLRNRHRALYELASINAGSYEDGRLGGVITYLRLGNYLAPNQETPNGFDTYSITGEPGIITNLSITVPNDASWDIDQQLAHYLTADISFKIIHRSRPERTRGGFIATIGPYLEGERGNTLNTLSDQETKAREKARALASAQDSEGNKFRDALTSSSEGVGSPADNFKRFDQINSKKLPTTKTYSTSDFQKPSYEGEPDSPDGYFGLDNVPYDGGSSGYESN